MPTKPSIGCCMSWYFGPVDVTIIILNGSSDFILQDHVYSANFCIVVTSGVIIIMSKLNLFLLFWWPLINYKVKFRVVSLMFRTGMCNFSSALSVRAEQNSRFYIQRTAIIRSTWWHLPNGIEKTSTIFKWEHDDFKISFHNRNLFGYH